jgi:hypothetical protein
LSSTGRVAGISGIRRDALRCEEAQVLQRLNSVEERFDYAIPSYLYPHAWPPGTEVLHWDPEEPAPLPAGRAVIGNELRVPAVWCEFGACIGRFSHPDALGMRDVRARAEAAGWCQDAFGRLGCPRCQQTDSGFRATHPVVPLADSWGARG